MLRMIHESVFNLQANMKINVVIISPFLSGSSREAQGATDWVASEKVND